MNRIPTDVVDIICSYVDDIDMDYKMEWRGNELYEHWDWHLFCKAIPRNVVEKYCFIEQDDTPKSRYQGCKHFFLHRIASEGNFCESFWEKMIDRIDFDVLICNPYLPLSFLEKQDLKKQLEWFWDGYSNHTIHLPWNFIQDNINYFNWYDLSRSINIPIHLFEQHIKELNWYGICYNPSIPEWFYEKYIKHISFYALCRNRSLSVEFFERHIDKVSWFEICQNESLPVEFFERHIDKVDWCSISVNEAIPTWFVEKYIHQYHPSYSGNSDKCRWRNICRFYPLTAKFLEKYIDDLDWYHLSSNPHVPISFFEKHVDKIHWTCISTNRTIPIWFYEKYHYKVYVEHIRTNENFIQYIKDMENKKVIYELFGI